MKNPLLLAALFFLHLAKAQSPSWGSITGPDSIPLGQRYEIDIKINSLPFSAGNLEYYYYDPDYLDLYATLTAPSGKVYQIDGFYFKDYTVPAKKYLFSGDNSYYPDWNYPPYPPHPTPVCYTYDNTKDTIFSYNNWELAPPQEVANSAKWKVRFVPLELGKWKVELTLKYRTDTTQPYQQINYSLKGGGGGSETFLKCTSTSLNPKGYIKVHANNQYLQYQNGDPLFLIGENVLTGGQGRMGNQQANTYYAGMVKIERMVDELTANGGNYGNLVLPTDSSSALIQLNGSGPYSRDMMFYQMNAFRYDHIIEYARSKDMCFKFLFLGPAQISQGGFWNNSPFNINNTAYPDAFLNSSNGQEYKSYQNYLRYIIARWGYATNIVAWDLLDEPETMGDVLKDQLPHATTWQYLKNWYDIMLPYIKQKDYNRHLTAVCFGNTHDDDNNLKQIWNSSLIDIASDNYSITFYIPDSSRLCDDTTGSPNFHYQTGSDCSDPNYRCGSNSDERRRHTDEEFFERPEAARVIVNKPFFRNSFWMWNVSQMWHFEEIKYSFFHHNAFWFSLFSGGFGTASPWDGPGYMHCPFKVGSNKRMTVLEHLRAIRRFSDLINRNDYTYESISANLLGKNTTSRSVPMFVTDSLDSVAWDVRCVALRQKNANTMIYGWVQDKNFELYNMYTLSPNHHNYKYSTTLLNTYKPPVLKNRNLKLTGLLNGTYKVYLYNILDTGISLSSTTNITTVSNVLTIPLGSFTGTYGDKAFRVEMIPPVTVFTGHCSNIDYARIGDTDGDGTEEVIINNRCNQYNGALWSLKFTGPSSYSTMCLLNHMGDKYDNLMDIGDELYVENINDLHKGDEIILVNKSTGDGVAVAVVNPSNGEFMSSISHTGYGFAGWFDTDDRTMLADINGTGIKKMVMLNYGTYNTSQGAIQVLDLMNNTVEHRENFNIGLSGWLDAGEDKAVMADINADGKKDLVLVNGAYVANQGALQGKDLTVDGCCNNIRTISHGPAGTDFFSWLDDCDRVLAGNIDGDAVEEIILINTNTAVGNAIRVIDLAAGIDDKPTVAHGIFGYWMDTDDRIFLANADTIPGLDLVFVNNNYQPGQGAIMVYNFVNSAVFIIFPGSSLSGWFDNADLQMVGKKMDGVTTNKDFLVLFNRDYNLSMNVFKVFNPKDYYTTNAAWNTTHYLGSFNNYWVNGYNNYSCGYFRDNDIEEGTPLMDVPEVYTEQTNMTLSPNPGKESFTIQLNNTVAQRVDVLDMMGKLIYTSGTINGNTLDINSAAWQEGMYLVKIYQKENKVSNMKFIKTK